MNITLCDPIPTLEFDTLVELLRSRAITQPTEIAFIFLEDGENQETSLTYQELDQQAQTIAGLLQSLNATGKRALMLYPPGLEFIVAFFGCLYAGVVAVPAYPPRLNQSLKRLQAIVADAQATISLTTSSILAQIERQFTQYSDLQAMSWFATDQINFTGVWEEPAIDAQTLAFLQYTSGSTSAPKGVMISHGNLIHNQRIIQTACQHNQTSSYVSWLPLYHDMGLGNTIQALFIGSQAILMSPVVFLQRPVRWLQAISRYRAHTSGGPNFAYELCIQKITAQQRINLDLSSWKVAFNGAEPIRSETLEKFTSIFAECGFSPTAFSPCYGLAESTVAVCGSAKGVTPVIYQVKGTELSQDRAIAATEMDNDTRTLVGCGQNWLDQKTIIVDPHTQMQCSAERVGEIWVAGPSVALGYWNAPIATKNTFQAYEVETGAGPFLRTGDLGFIKDGELFVTGRIKDLIIIRGRNHYPQ